MFALYIGQMPEFDILKTQNKQIKDFLASVCLGNTVTNISKEKAPHWDVVHLKEIGNVICAHPEIKWIKLKCCELCWYIPH